MTKIALKSAATALLSALALVAFSQAAHADEIDFDDLIDKLEKAGEKAGK